MKAVSGRARVAELSVAAWLLAAFFTILLLAGGASRSDVLGQVVTRTAAFLILIAMLLTADREAIRPCGAVPWLLAAVIALPLMQLVPLPPGLWRALPGREEVLLGLPASVQGDVWRPLSLSPGNTVNAAVSLIVPAVVLALLCQLRPSERRWLPFFMLALVAVSMVFGLLQFTGLQIEQQLINYSADVRGTFANRNHFALFLALGCLITPYVAVAGGRNLRWLREVAIGLLLLLLLTILFSGSRMGLLLAGLALVAGCLAVGERLAKAWRERLRRVAIVGGGVIAVAVLFASVQFQRAASINRLSDAEIGEDMRVRALPTVLSMVREYAPAGDGLGTFDPVFRMHEPFGLLKPTYFNRAHNDLVEIVLDAGLPGLLIIVAALLWWAVASWRVWRRRPEPEVAAARIGSATIALVVLASVVDYPARTPLFMGVIVIAATLLAWGARVDHSGHVRASSL